MIPLRFLTDDEKARRVAEWRTLQEQLPADRPTFPEDGTPDPAIFEFTNAVNELPGMCTAQSCSGHHWHRPVYEPAECPTCEGSMSVAPWQGDGVERDGMAPCPSCQCDVDLYQSGRIWLLASEPTFWRLLRNAGTIAANPLIEQVAALYGREADGPVVEIIFMGEEHDALDGSTAFLLGCLTHISRGLDL